MLPAGAALSLGSDGNLSAARTEPIAADARPGKDGKNNAKLKLISGLLGVGYDTLRRREQQRRNARLFAFSCAAAAGMVLTSGLAAYALVQRAAAQRETLRAEAEARTSKETTRFLVDLFKIFDPSEARGSTVTAREMLDKGAVRIESELAEEPAIQATLMDTRRDGVHGPRSLCAGAAACSMGRWRHGAACRVSILWICRIH